MIDKRMASFNGIPSNIVNIDTPNANVSDPSSDGSSDKKWENDQAQNPLFRIKRRIERLT